MHVSTQKPRNGTIFYVGALLLMLSGCAVGPDYHRPEVAVPEQYKETRSSSDNTEADKDSWWTLFEDSYLNELEQQVIVSNQNIVAAEAAHREALSAITVQRAALLPAVNANAQGLHSAKSTPNGTASASNEYAVGAGVSWQIDLWGKLRRSLQAAQANAQASEADLAAATLSNRSLLASTYMQLRESDAELQLVSETVATYRRAAEITNNRYRAGAAAKSDALQAEVQLSSAEATLASLQLQRAQLEHAIAALIGQPASTFTIVASEQWNAVLPSIPNSLPSELLRRRPDIVAAERSVAAASANIGVQKAAYFPSLTLSGTYSFVSQTASNIFDPSNGVWNVAANAAGTIFDAGATSAHVRAARAAYEVAVAQYRQTVFDAFKNVEDQLAATTLLAIQIEAQRKAATSASEAEQLIINQYKAGRISYTDVATVQTAALNARRNLAQIELKQQTTAVNLFAAMGGEWHGLSASN
jgi:NodT family efflux transporter outer membrane factor (OMF) lipoprotein